MKHGIWALLLAFTNSALAVPDWTPARIAKIEPERARVIQSGAEASIYCHRKKWPPGGGSDGASQMSGRFRNKVLACLACPAGLSRPHGVQVKLDGNGRFQS